MVNDANVTLTDVITSNGLIHVIDKVLMPTDSPRDIPRTAQCTGVHDSLVAGVIQAELLSTLQGPGPFTVFAPTDQAFIDAGIDLASLDTPEGKATLSDILLYHVVAGEVPAANVSECMSADAVNGQPLAFTVDGGVMVNDANVTLPDVMTSNGIIHVIDKVLMPSDAPNDIPRTAQCTGIHDSLVAAVIQAELLETLQSQGPPRSLLQPIKPSPMQALISHRLTLQKERQSSPTFCSITSLLETYHRLLSPSA